MNTVNRDFMSEEEKMAVERDEEERKKAILGTSKAHLTQMLRTSGLTSSGDPAADINNPHIDRRS